ncbi:DUF2249 domain-containing protein [Paenibacillus camelliae]|uniref:DUF2249 domain-containing protein n=1 Tax=Paenibacillus camelliae TaxID=512410 RepID=UPI00203E4CF7|nr:DUF2249 domain-containing protein [Paenibacillus camelliae]MCM3632756.1 DUF2249 domain-containing protein [Paenibacillus camelliae]
MERKEANVVELDVRPHLRKKLEPFQLIMDTVKTLDKKEIFLLHATFKPTPLLGLLKMKGLIGKAEQISKEHWITTFVHKSNKHWLEDDSKEDILIENDIRLQEGAETDQINFDDEPAKDSKIIRLDNRGLEPPKPMMRTLAAIDRCHAGDEVHIHNDRVPVFLIEELNSLGCPYEVEEQADGSAKIKIRKV